MHRDMPAALARVSERLPAMVIDTLREQWARVARLDEEIGEIERRIALWHRGNADGRRIAEIPGVGVLTATAAVAAMGDPSAFRSGRESPPGSAWCPGMRALGDGCACSASQSAGTGTSEPADPRRPFRAHHRQGTAGMGGATGRAAADERRHGRAGEQDGAHDLGPAGP